MYMYMYSIISGDLLKLHQVSCEWNVCTPRNSQAEILTPRAVVSGGRSPHDGIRAL